VSVRIRPLLQPRALSGELLLLVVVTDLLIGGAVLWMVGSPSAAVLWGLATAVAVVPAVVWVAEDLRAGRFGADVLALLALLGTLLVHEFLAGAVVALMVSTGRALDICAQQRARRDLTALLDRAPRHVRVRGATGLRTVPIAEVVAGDVLLVAQGEVVPVDGRLSDDARFDESVLTGDSAPVERPRGDAVRSGVVNAGPAVDLIAAVTGRDSTYAGVIAVAEQAAVGSAPVVRIADRLAAVFLPVAVIVAGLAALLTHDPARAVAVLVTATPCPLLLAVPVAINAGLSRASRAGVVVRDGRSLEALGHVKVAVLDKIGTVTLGHPVVTEVVPAPGQSPTDVLRLAAAVEQVSSHVLARAVVHAAGKAGPLPLPASDVVEHPGHGVAGTVGGRRVSVGRPSVIDGDLPVWARGVARRARLEAVTSIWVEGDGQLLGTVLARDEIRPDARWMLRRLRSAGLSRIVLLTGDRGATSREVGGLLAADDVVAGCTPADKVTRVIAERARGVTAMVGDGLNAAPALAAADVGVALGNRASTAAVQAADAVLLDDRVDRLGDAVEIAGRARRVAVQSAVIGVALSLVTMGFAAAGLLPPVFGALVQEAIDLAVIANALRTLLPAAPRSPLRHAQTHTQRPPQEEDRYFILTDSARTTHWLAGDDDGGASGAGGEARREPPGNRSAGSRSTVIRAVEVMTREVTTTEPGARIQDAAAVLTRNGYTAMPVVDGDGRFVGIVNEGDLMRDRVSTDPRSLRLGSPEVGPSTAPSTVSDVMTCEVVVVTPQADLVDVARLMLDRGVRSIPVLDSDRLVGIISRRDMLRAVCRGDPAIASDVQHHLAMYGAPYRWRVSVHDGRVRILDEFDNAQDRHVVAVLARAVPGVVDVEVRFASDEGVS
jgi:heavy metal translocating P-type ATPase